MFKQIASKLTFLFLIGTSLIFCSTSENNEAKVKEDSVAKQNLEGKKIFSTYCVLCHGADGKMGLNGAKDFSLSILDLEERIKVIKEGRNLMTPFGELLSDEEIKAVAQYTIDEFPPNEISE
jgi:mono/diheme cytochrome c family protein